MTDIENKYDVLLLRLLKYKSDEYKLSRSEKRTIKKLQPFEAFKNDLTADSVLLSNDSIDIEYNEERDVYGNVSEKRRFITEKGIQDIKRYSSLSKILSDTATKRNKAIVTVITTGLLIISTIGNIYFAWSNKSKDDEIKALKQELNHTPNDTLEKNKNVP